MTHYIFEGGLKLRQKVRALVINTADMLLLIRPHGYHSREWTLAGGGLEQGETPDAAITRELQEELRLHHHVAIRRLTASNRFIYAAEYKAKRGLDHDGQHAVMYAVLVHEDFQPRLQKEEIADARWFSRAEAITVLPVAAQRTILEACLAEVSAARREGSREDCAPANPRQSRFAA